MGSLRKPKGITRVTITIWFFAITIVVSAIGGEFTEFVEACYSDSIFFFIIAKAFVACHAFGSRWSFRGFSGSDEKERYLILRTPKMKTGLELDL
ncbi:hypothetical protein VNO78_18540 [Psophocarpus tetragonolobus]|uniref:Transmembrane protein n=1 Tax=Psophocarpus tetragonolobus TaxID=3891 RepID=A0AAN9SJI9_PSOTE